MKRVETVEEHGATTIHCVDAAGSNANLQITAQGTAELAGTTVTLDSAGAITFERGSNSVEVPDAAGTLQLQGAKTGQIINVSLMKDDNYVLYLNTRTYWYSTAGYNYTGNIIHPNFSRAVYPCYTLDNGFISKRIYGHRLFAMAFVFNEIPNIKYNVDHTNEDKLDYAVSNLKWVTVSENMKNISNRAVTKKNKYKVYYCS